MEGKRKYDKRIVIGLIAVAVLAVAGLVIYLIFGTKSGADTDHSSSSSPFSESTVSQAQSEISEQASEPPLEQSEPKGETAPTLSAVSQPPLSQDIWEYSEIYSQAPSPQDEPQQNGSGDFSIPTEMINALKMTKNDLFGSYIPQKEWQFGKYGGVYDKGKFRYNYYDDSVNDQVPVSINVDSRDLFGGGSSRNTSSELMQKLGKYFVAECYDEYGYGHHWVAVWQGYWIDFSGSDSSNLFATTIYSPEYADYAMNLYRSMNQVYY